MFDDVEVLSGKLAESLKCAAGHRLTKFQTKDFACNLDLLLVVDDELFLNGRGEGVWSEWTKTGDGMTQTITRKAEPYPVTDYVNIYDFCKECAKTSPRYIFKRDRDDAWSMRMPTAVEPWCEWRLHVVDGRIASVQVERVETVAERWAESQALGAIEVFEDPETRLWAPKSQP